MPRIVDYEVYIGDHARRRHFHEGLQGRIVRFTVQLEVWHDNVWQPVLRYDGHHGYPHVDAYRGDGRKRKITLDMSFEEALTTGDKDIRERAAIYIERFLKGEWP